MRLVGIEDFIAQANAGAAGCLVHQIVQRGEALSKFPEGTGLREIIEGRYRIVYRIQAKDVQVVTAFEGHRQFPAEDVAE